MRPESDFLRIGITPPKTLNIAYRGPADADVPALCREAKVMVIPAVGPKLPTTLFDGSPIKLVQVTGAGVDRVDEAEMKRRGIAVANVPGGSNSALAEYTVVNALNLMRRFSWADAQLKAGLYEAGTRGHGRRQSARPRRQNGRRHRPRRHRSSGRAGL